ncbi:ATP-binding cassette domain-containing protein, partial [bacterium]|nr:ATP-binding cassette domain-containing protein [bacterium]
MIQLVEVSKSFNSYDVLKGISLHIREKETLVICGPGGCGKTVIMKLCQGLIKPDKGKIYLKGKNIGLMTKDELMKFRLDSGVLFQNYA